MASYFKKNDKNIIKIFQLYIFYFRNLFENILYKNHLCKKPIIYKHFLFSISP